MKSDASDHLMGIELAMFTTFEIECDLCHVKHKDFGDSKHDAALGFYKDGWREFDEEVFCPDCANGDW